MWSVRRTLSKQSGIHAMAAKDGEDVEEGKALVADDKHHEPSRHKSLLGIPTVLLAGICYCCASGSMVLLNKHALASFNFTAPNALLCFQCLLSVILVKICGMFGLVKMQPLKWDLVAVWFPVNLIFVVSCCVCVYAQHTLWQSQFLHAWDVHMWYHEFQ